MPEKLTRLAGGNRGLMDLTPRPLLPQAAGTSFPAENPCSFSFGGGTEVGQMKACPAPDGGGEGTE